MFTEEDIDNHVKHYIEAARSFIDERREVIPVCFVFCTVDPRDGSPGYNIAPLIMGGDNRAAFSHAVQTIAVAGCASHAVFVSDGYFAVSESKTIDCRVRDLPNAREALCVLVHRRATQETTSIRIPYVCDQGQVLWDDEIRHVGPATAGALQLMPPSGPVPADVLESARMMAKLMVGGQRPGVRPVERW